MVTLGHPWYIKDWMIYNVHIYISAIYRIFRLLKKITQSRTGKFQVLYTQWSDLMGNVILPLEDIVYFTCWQLTLTNCSSQTTTNKINSLPFPTCPERSYPSQNRSLFIIILDLKHVLRVLQVCEFVVLLMNRSPPRAAETAATRSNGMT